MRATPELWKQMNAKIRDLAAEIVLMKPKSPSEATLYNFAFGALYAFKMAIDLGYLDQYRKEANRRETELLSMRRARQVKKLAINLSGDHNLPSVDWFAGYYYNDALIRADVCYEQLARFSGKVKGKSDRKGRKKLEDLAINHGLSKELIVPWWKKVREEVNNLKHQSIYLTEGPPLSPETALHVIEHLIKGVKSVFHRR